MAIHGLEGDEQSVEISSFIGSPNRIFVSNDMNLCYMRVCNEDHIRTYLQGLPGSTKTTEVGKGEVTDVIADNSQPRLNRD